MKKAPFHPTLFALMPVLSLYVTNLEQLRFKDAAPSILVTVVAAHLLWLGIHLLTKDILKSAIITSAFLFLFFSFDHFLTIIKITLFSLQLENRLYLVESKRGVLLWLLILGLVFAWISYKIVKSEKRLSDLNHTINLISLVLIGTIVAMGLNKYFQINLNAEPDDAVTTPNTFAIEWDTQMSKEISAFTPETSPEELPDIYYFILDGYGRADILKDIYALDNADFLAFLEQQGFFIADQSRTNYVYTNHSIASSLNFQYLDALQEQFGQDSNNLLPLTAMIENNRVSNLLTKAGYKIVVFSSGVPATNSIDADIYLAPEHDVNVYQQALINNTPLAIFLVNAQYSVHRDHILYTLNHIGDTLVYESPRFVFVHILAPHPPFVFGADGEYVNPRYNFATSDTSDYMRLDTPESYMLGYKNQLLFMNSQIEYVVTELISNSTTPPVIIFQGDHGPGSRWNTLDVSVSDTHERTSILNAYYFPDQDYTMLSEDITPVNTFRVVLNKYLDFDLDILPNTSFALSWDRPYDFIEVPEQ